jgi:hypothetical protein
MLVNMSEQSDHHFFKGLLTRKEVVASLDKSYCSKWRQTPQFLPSYNEKKL